MKGGKEKGRKGREKKEEKKKRRELMASVSGRKIFFEVIERTREGKCFVVREDIFFSLLKKVRGREKFCGRGVFFYY